jgi:hypothetical protein
MIATLKQIYKAGQLNEEWRQIAKASLHDWIKINFGIHIPRNKVCEDHCAPFDFVSDTFFSYHTDVIALANRNGGKTINFAILDVINSLTHANCETATIGAIQEQASKCYSYFQKFLEHPHIAEEVQSSLISKTSFKNGSLVQILTGTITGVNSPHPNKAFLDEVDLMNWTVLQEAFSMARTANGITGQNIITSTRKFLGGPMSRLIDQKDAYGFKLYQWCIREVIEQHDEEECRTSIYHEDCKGACKKSDGFYSFKDVISKKKKLDPNIWESQWMCKKPESTGLMYPQFQAITYPVGNLYEWEYNPRIDFYIFEDFGFGEDHPDVALFAQIDWDKKTVYIFDEQYRTGTESYTITMDIVKKMREEHKINIVKVPDVEKEYYNFSDFLTGWIGDPAGLNEKAERARLGAPILEDAEQAEVYRINNGASLLRTMFKSQRILIHPRCVKLIGELNMYRKRRNPDGTYQDKPDKKNDHGPDALRYGIVRLFPMEVLGSFGEDDTVDEEGQTAYAPITKGLIGKVF